MISARRVDSAAADATSGGNGAFEGVLEEINETFPNSSNA